MYAIVLELRKHTAQKYADVRKSIIHIQQAASNAVSILSRYKELQAAAQVQLAIAANADYVMQGNKPVPLPVNTVMRRQSDAARRRYKVALSDAKYLAHLARLAIEQRLGVRMNYIDEPFGPLPEPSIAKRESASFRDSVCGATTTGSFPARKLMG